MTPRSGLSLRSEGATWPCFFRSLEEKNPPSGMPAPLLAGWMTAVILGFQLLDDRGAHGWVHSVFEAAQVEIGFRTENMPTAESGRRWVKKEKGFALFFHNASASWTRRRCLVRGMNFPPDLADRRRIEPVLDHLDPRVQDLRSVV